MSIKPNKQTAQVSMNVEKKKDHIIPPMTNEKNKEEGSSLLYFITMLSLMQTI